MTTPKSLYITAVVTYSGKTALLLGIALKLQERGRKIGYYKPLSTQPLFAEGKVVDEDAEFVKRVLKLSEPASELSSVIIDDRLIDKLLHGDSRDYIAQIKADYATLGAGKDVLLVEGGASMREGYIVGANVQTLVGELNLPTLAVVRYRDGLMTLDDVLAAATRMGDHLLGVVINAVPAEAMPLIKNQAVPFLQKRGIKVYGVLPQDQALMALTVGEVVETLNARVLAGADQMDALIENLSVGAMSAEQAMPRFRRLVNKAVITGGDRADIQLAALETSTTALILTGNLQPNASIVQRAQEQGVAVLLLPGSTIEAIEAVENLFGHTRLAHPVKLARYREMLDANFEWDLLFTDLGV